MSLISDFPCIWTEWQLNKNVPQLKITYNLDAGAGESRAAEGPQCNLPKGEALKFECAVA